MSKRTSLRVSTSIPYEIKVLLDSLEQSDERPPMLAKWAREVFAAGKKHERTKEEIADWVEQYALEKDYSERQIQRVLKDNGATKHPEFSNRGSVGRHMSPYNYVARIKDLVAAITGLRDNEVEKTHNPSKLAEQVEPKIVNIARQTSPGEKAALLKYVQDVIPLLQRLEKLLKEERSSVRLER